MMAGPIARDASAGDWVERITAAADQLTPVAIELSSPHRTLHSYLSAVVRTRGASRAVLSPIHGASLRPGMDVVIRPMDETPWELRAAVTRVEPREAEVDLSRARYGGVAEAGVAVTPEPGLLVFVVPGGLHGVSGYVFPICKIGHDACQIETPEALEPGTVISVAQVVGDRRILRRARAHVLDTFPIVRADGTAVFRCELSLGAVSSIPPAAHDVVSDVKEVRRLLEFAALTHARGWYEAPGWGRGTLTFARLDSDCASLELEGRPDGPCPETSIRVGTELFAVQYEFEVRVLSHSGTRAETSLPMILRRRRSHRREHLVPVPEGESVRLDYVNPISGATVQRQVAALSFFSIRFAAEFDDAMLWSGLPLERAQLTWRDEVIFLGDLEVGDASDAALPDTVSALASDSRVADDNGMIALIAACHHPSVRTHDGDDFSALHDAYVKAGLFAPHMHRNLEPIIADATDVWRRMHTETRDLVRTFVHPAEGPVDAAVTAMRAWEWGWVAQHFVDVNPSLNGATGKLQTAYLDHLLPRPDGRYLVFFVKSDNHVMTSYMRRFFGDVGTDEPAAHQQVELWVHDGEDLAQAVDPSRAISASERTMVEHACHRCFGTDAVSALSMTAAHLDLSDTRARFAEAGLVRERSCRVVERAGKVSHALIEERSTPGINLTWMLNATWVIPVHASDPDDLGAALDSVVARPAQTPTGERFLNLPTGLDERVLEGRGFKRLALVEMFILNRARVHQLVQYASRRYGELDARAERRGRRRKGALPAPE